MAKSPKYYTIKVGVSKPQVVEMGEINKATGLPMGVTEKADSVVGRITIPNYSKIFVIADRIENQLTGKFKAVEWGHKDGEVMEIRYSSNCQSLLKLYQEQKKINFNESESELTLMYGLNNYDPEKEPMLVQMLQLHTYNGDNKSRDPANNNIVFREYKPDLDAGDDVTAYEHLAEAMAFLHTIQDDPRRLRTMAIAFVIDEMLPDDKIILKLMQRAHHEPKKFLADKEDHFTKVQAILYRAHDLNLVHLDGADITMGEDHELVIGGFKKLEGVKKLDFLVQSAFEPDAAEAIEKISKALAFREAHVEI